MAKITIVVPALRHTLPKEEATRRERRARLMNLLYQRFGAKHFSIVWPQPDTATFSYTKNGEQIILEGSIIITDTTVEIIAESPSPAGINKETLEAEILKIIQARAETFTPQLLPLTRLD